MSSAIKCAECVSLDGWHFHECGRPAKRAFQNIESKMVVPVCGIHTRRYKENKRWWVETPLSTPAQREGS